MVKIIMVKKFNENNLVLFISFENKKFDLIITFCYTYSVVSSQVKSKNHLSPIVIDS